MFVHGGAQSGPLNAQGLTFNHQWSPDINTTHKKLRSGQVSEGIQHTSFCNLSKILSHHFPTCDRLFWIFQTMLHVSWIWGLGHIISVNNLAWYELFVNMCIQNRMHGFVACQAVKFSFELYRWYLKSICNNFSYIVARIWTLRIFSC